MSLLDKKTAKQYDNASTQINVPPEIADEIRRIGKELIPDEHLAGDGRVELLHITIKYGVEPDQRTLQQAIAGYKSFEVALGKIVVFPEGDDKSSPVVIEVHGHEFKALHEAVAAAMGTMPDDYPYTPHITIAYVKSKEAQHYAGNDAFVGTEFVAEAVTLSMFDDDNQVDVPLTKAAAGMPTFQAWFKNVGGVNGFLSDSDVSLIYEEDFREVADEDDSDAAFIAYITERMKEDYGTLARFFRKFKWPIPIYRAITVESVDHIDTTMAGVHWTWNADAPEAYWGEHNQGAVILKAFAKPSDIDWKTTITKNLHPSRGEDEAEITIKKGAKLQFAGYCSDKEYWGGNRKWTPLPGTKTVTAAQVAEIPEIAPQYQHEEEQPEEEEEVQRDEPATEQGEEQPKPQKRQPKNKLLQPKKLKEVKPKKPPVETTNFKKWFGKSQVRDESGKPLVVYHGTTHDFEAFDPNTGNPENHYGKALYFTSSKTDVSENYATEAGPDLTSRIDNRSERIMQEWEDQWDDVKDDLGLGDIEEFPSYSEVGYKRVQERAKQEAKKEVAGQSQGMTMPVYLSLQNPVVVQKRGGTQFQVIIDDDGNESGNGLDMYNAMHLVGGNFNADVQGMWSALFENTDGDFNAWDFEKVVRGRDDVEDDEGNLVPGNYIAQVYQEMGFDGIIQSAYEAFGPQSLGPGYGQTKGMTMDRDTKHYILWDPHKIKSAIGNKGKFDRKNPNITAAVKTWWHVSTVTNRASILANGLKVPKREDRQFYSKHTPGVYVFPSESEALNWTWNMWGSFRDSERGLDLWRVRIDDKLMKADNHPESEGAYYTTKSVPASNVKLESYLTEDGNQHDPSDEDGHFDEDDVVYLDDEKTAAVTKRVITVDELPAETQGDLACELSEHLNEMGVRLPHDPDRELDCDDVRQNLTGLVDPPNITVYDAPVAPLYKTMHRTFSGGANNAAVKKYMEMLKSGMEFDPIFVVNGKFHDGGHRMEAYYRAGRKTIPVAEIGPFLRAKPEFWKRWFADDPSAKFATMKIALNVPRLVKDFGQKFLARVQKDRSAPTAYHAPVETEEQVQQQATALINQIAQTDPSPNKEYTAWIVGNYARGGINRWEDIQARIVPALKKFDTLKLTKKLPVAERDIMKVKGIEGLEDLMEKYKEVEAVSEGQKERDVEQGFFKNGEAEIIHDDAQIKIIYPKSQKAACFFGINTRWCTAATEGRNYFDHYNKQGPLYIVLIKADNKRYQLHFQSDSYMDERDKAINPWDLTDSYPVLKKIFQPVVLGLMRNDANIRASFVAFVENPDTNMMLKAVDEDPSVIDRFPDAPEEVKWRAFCRRLGLPEENYDQQLQGFVIAEYTNVEDFAADRGDDAAKWAAKISTGGETLDFDSSGYQASTVLEACADDTIAKINEYIQFNHDKELQEWLSDNDETFPLSLRAIESFIDESDPGDLDDKLRSGWYSGEESGSQDEIVGALKSAVLGLESSGTEYGTAIVLDREKFWDTPIKEILSLADAQKLVQENPDGIDLWEDVDRNRDSEILKVRQPYYGFSGFSDEACNERVADEFYVSSKEKLERKEQAQPKPVASSLLKKGVGERSVGDLGLAKRIMHELMPVLGVQLPEPELKIVNSPRSGWLGEDVWRIGVTNNMLWGKENTTIRLQKSILNDEDTLRRILAHELAHHADNLVNGTKLIEKYQGTGQVGYRMFLGELRRVGHGKGWKEYAQKYNTKYGVDFVTEKSDETYVQEALELKPYYIRLWKNPNGKIYYAVAARFGPAIKRYLEHKAVKPSADERMTTTNEHMFIDGATIGSGWSVPRGEDKEKRLVELWETAQPDKQAPLSPETQFKRDFVQGWNEAEQRRKETKKSSLLNKKADVPQLQQLEHGVSKDYDRVRWVYQQFYDSGIQSMSWKDFQKKFPKEQNSPLFTKIRQNRPTITLEDMDRWMEEYNTKAKEYQNYEIEHGTYQNKNTSFRDVEQLVLRINQSASAKEIIGEDPLIAQFIQMVGQSSEHYDHPVSENTVGWLRVDFIDDDWLLVDEVQSDLINAVSKAKGVLAAPNLKEYINSFPDALKEKAKEELGKAGINERVFQQGKAQVQQRGYTPEKLDEIKQQLVGLFKDWAEYGIASLMEIARRHGIKNVAINTSENLAKREPLVEEKSSMYYDQLAKSFGFKQQQLDVGDLKGNFWVRTAGKRSEATTSMTVGTTDPNFPMPVLIRWEQGMRWRQVLKTVKAIVSEIAGRRVPWREIHIWASLWDSQQAQQEGWEQEKAKGTRVMYDVLHNGTFVRVGSGAPVEVTADSHKVTPLDDTQYDNPEIGQETNAYADIPERVRGTYDVPSLRTLVPQIFWKDAAGAEYHLEVLDSYKGELYCRVDASLGGERVGYVEFNEVERDVELEDTEYYKEQKDEHGGQYWERIKEIPKEIWIKMVWVDPAHRRKGIASGMYQKIRQEFPGEKITSSGTTPEGGKLREKLTERGVLAKRAVYGEAQNQVQHTDHQTYGMTKTLKSDPFSEEMKALQKENIEPNPILDSGRAEGQPQAKGEDQLQMNKMNKAGVKSLQERLEALRPVFAQAAQDAYESGPEHAWQGVCYHVAAAILEEALSHNPSWGGEVVDFGEHHSCAVICDRKNCFRVDIPFEKYEKFIPREEKPGNMAYDSDMPWSFELLPDVQLKPEDIEIVPAERPWKRKGASEGQVCLLHFDASGKSYHHLGWTRDTQERMALGAKIAQAHKSTFTVARVWDGADRSFERRLKSGALSRWCPICHSLGPQQKQAGKKFPPFDQWVKAHPKFDVPAEAEHGYHDPSGDMTTRSELEERYLENTQWLSQLDLPLTIYRALEVEDNPNKFNVNFDKMGIYWTWVENSAETYFGQDSIWNPGTRPRLKKPLLVIVKAVVTKPGDIDFDHTLKANMTDPEENEITLNPGAKLKLVGMDWGEGYKIPKGQHTITAAATGNVEAAIEEIDATYPVNPLNQRENVVTVGGNPLAVVEVAPRSGRLRLRGIRSLQQGKGAGSQALKLILAIADKHGVEVELTASPFGDESTRLDKDALQAWYRKNKFEDEPGYDPSLGYMVRKPKSAAGAVNIDWKTGMFENYKLVPEFSWHEAGDKIDDDEKVGESNWNLLVVSAFDTTKKQVGMPGKFVGSADFVLRGGQLESANTEVDKSYWRQGIATALYQYAEGLTGFMVKPHLTQSPAGRSLWQQKSRPFGRNAAADVRKIVEAGGGKYRGMFGTMVIFNSPVTDSSYTLEEAGLTPEAVRDEIEKGDAKFGKTGAQTVSGEDVVSYVQKLNKWDRQTAYQTVGLDAGGDYVLKDFPVGRLVAGDAYDPELAERYAKQKGEFPPIVLGLASRAHRDKPIMVNYYVIRDGNHRVAAAKLRGDSKIMAYVPLDSTKEKR